MGRAAPTTTEKKTAFIRNYVVAALTIVIDETAWDGVRDNLQTGRVVPRRRAKTTRGWRECHRTEQPKAAAFVVSEGKY
jgi:hypothetical protein